MITCEHCKQPIEVGQSFVHVNVGEFANKDIHHGCLNTFAEEHLGGELGMLWKNYLLVHHSRVTVNMPAGFGQEQP